MANWATLTDWAWVEMMIFQSMIGMLTPDVLAVSLKEEEIQWVVTFSLARPVSENKMSDLVEIAGDAEAYLEQRPREPSHTSSAILKPIKSLIRMDARGEELKSSMDNPRERLLFAWDWEESASM
jgi:hypothetical protein